MTATRPDLSAYGYPSVWHTAPDLNATHPIHCDLYIGHRTHCGLSPAPPPPCGLAVPDDWEHQPFDVVAASPTTTWCFPCYVHSHRAIRKARRRAARTHTRLHEEVPE